jgi:hypothetical protein
LYFSDYIGGNVYMTITTSGNVGIANSAPGYTFDVKGTARINNTSSKGSLTVSNDIGNVSLGIAQNVDDFIIGSIPSDAVIVTGTGQNLLVQTGTSSTLYLAYTSLIGIGTTSPSGSLHISKNETLNCPQLVLDGSDLSDKEIVFYNDSINDGGGKIYRPAGENDIRISFNGSDKFVVNSIGNVGIGVAGPSYRLDVAGNGHISGDLLVDGSISGSGSSSSTFAYLTLTSTDDAINLTTGSLVTFGGITVQSPTDSESITNGGALLVNGGASVYSRLFVGGGIESIKNPNTFGNLITTTNGNIGIGNTNPLATFDIVSANTFGNIYLGNVEAHRKLVLSSTANNDHEYIGLGVTDGNFAIHSTKNIDIYTASSATSSSLISSFGSDSNVYIYNGLFVGQNKTLQVSSNTIASAISSSSDLNLLSSVTVTTTGNVGVGFTSPSYKLDISGQTRIVTGLRVSDDTSNTRYIDLTFDTNGNSQILSGTAGNLQIQSVVTVTTNGNVGIGTSSPNQLLDVNGTINATKVSISSTQNADGTDGALVITGGETIKKDLYVGGQLFVNGVNASVLTGSVTCGSHISGILEISGIPITATMGNTNYKVIGNLATTTDNYNVYTVCFKNLTTTTFDALVYRLDALASGFEDPNLRLNWAVYP